MIKSMFSGVSGLRAHQSKMDVIGNNIANVNTYSFKAGRASFKDAFYQTMTPATDADNAYGGGNPYQVGYGSQIGSVDTLHTRGSFAPTDNPMDVMIEGNGYFMVGTYSKDGYGPVQGGAGDDLTTLNLTRVGILNIDGAGNLVDGNKNHVYGYKAYEHPTKPGEFSYGAPWKEDTPGPPPTYKVGDKKLEAIQVPKMVTTGKGEAITINGKAVTPQFDGDGKYDAAKTHTEALKLFTGGVFVAAEAKPACVTVDDFNNMILGKVTVPADPTDVAPSTVGNPKLSGVTISGNGVISGQANGAPIVIGQIAIANVPNPNALEASSGGYYKARGNTGTVTAEVPGQGSTGGLKTGGLEMANVDLAKEFSDMITTQRGFQANTRIITVSDEMLQELVNLKR